MGFHVGIKDIIVSGGVTLTLLIGLSIYSIALIWERWRFVKRSTKGLKPILDKIRHVLSEGELSEAVILGQSYKGLASAVIMTSLVGSTNRDERKGAAARAGERAAGELTRNITTLGTIASTAPFIGLFGTVIGVMRAFRDLASTAGAGPGVVAVGISEALVCTAAGLFVAIPAVAAYNYFNAKAASFQDEMKWLSDEIIESLAEKSRSK